MPVNYARICLLIALGFSLAVAIWNIVNLVAHRQMLFNGLSVTMSSLAFAMVFIVLNQSSCTTL